jgi:hypothetical protein
MASAFTLYVADSVSVSDVRIDAYTSTQMPHTYPTLPEAASQALQLWQLRGKGDPILVKTEGILVFSTRSLQPGYEWLGEQLRARAFRGTASNGKL